MCTAQPPRSLPCRLPPPPQVEGEGWSDCARRGLAVKAIKGNALLFYGLKPNGDEDPSSTHGSCPTLAGEKWSATRWVGRGWPAVGGAAEMVSVRAIKTQSLLAMADKCHAPIAPAAAACLAGGSMCLPSSRGAPRAAWTMRTNARSGQSWENVSARCRVPQFGLLLPLLLPLPGCWLCGRERRGSQVDDSRCGGRGSHARLCCRREQPCIYEIQMPQGL